MTAFTHAVEPHPYGMGNGEDASHTYIHVNIITGIPGAVTAQSVSLACLKQKGFLFEAIKVKFLFTLVPFVCFLNTARLSYSYHCVRIWQSLFLRGLHLVLVVKINTNLLCVLAMYACMYAVTLVVF